MPGLERRGKPCQLPILRPSQRQGPWAQGALQPRPNAKAMPRSRGCSTALASRFAGAGCGRYGFILHARLVRVIVTAGGLGSEGSVLVGIITLLRGSIGRPRLDVPVSALTTAAVCWRRGLGSSCFGGGSKGCGGRPSRSMPRSSTTGVGAPGRCPIDMPAGFALEAGAISGPAVAPDLGLARGRHFTLRTCHGFPDRHPRS